MELTLEELENEIRRADANGDREGVQRLAEYYQQRLSEEASGSSGASDNRTEANTGLGSAVAEGWQGADRMLGHATKWLGDATGIEALNRYGDFVINDANQDSAEINYQRPEGQDGFAQDLKQGEYLNALGSTAHTVAGAAPSLAPGAVATIGATVGAPLVAAGGAALTAYMALGGQRQEAEEKGLSTDPTWSDLGTAVAQGAVELVPGPGKGFIIRLLNEGSQEAVQEVMTIGNTAFKGGEYVPEEVAERILNSAVAGAGTHGLVEGGAHTVAAVGNGIGATGRAIGNGIRYDNQTYTDDDRAAADLLIKKAGYDYDRLGNVDTTEGQNSAQGIAKSARSELQGQVSRGIRDLQRLADTEYEINGDHDTLTNRRRILDTLSRNAGRNKDLIASTDLDDLEASFPNIAEAHNLRSLMNQLARVSSFTEGGGDIGGFSHRIFKYGDITDPRNNGIAKGIASFASLSSIGGGIVANKMAKGLDKRTNRRSKVKRFVESVDHFGATSFAPTKPDLDPADLVRRDMKLQAEIDQKYPEAVRLNEQHDDNLYDQAQKENQDFDKAFDKLVDEAWKKNNELKGNLDKVLKANAQVAGVGAKWLKEIKKEKGDAERLAKRAATEKKAEAGIDFAKAAVDAHVVNTAPAFTDDNFIIPAGDKRYEGYAHWEQGTGLKTKQIYELLQTLEATPGSGVHPGTSKAFRDNGFRDKKAKAYALEVQGIVKDAAGKSDHRYTPPPGFSKVDEGTPDANPKKEEGRRYKNVLKRLSDYRTVLKNRYSALVDLADRMHDKKLSREDRAALAKTELPALLRGLPKPIKDAITEDFATLASAGSTKVDLAEEQELKDSEKEARLEARKESIRKKREAKAKEKKPATPRKKKGPDEPPKDPDPTPTPPKPKGGAPKSTPASKPKTKADRALEKLTTPPKDETPAASTSVATPASDNRTDPVPDLDAFKKIQAEVDAAKAAKKALPEAVPEPPRDLIKSSAIDAGIMGESAKEKFGHGFKEGWRAQKKGAGRPFEVMDENYNKGMARGYEAASDNRTETPAEPKVDKILEKLAGNKGLDNGSDIVYNSSVEELREAKDVDPKKVMPAKRSTKGDIVITQEVELEGDVEINAAGRKSGGDKSSLQKLFEKRVAEWENVDRIIQDPSHAQRLLKYVRGLPKSVEGRLKNLIVENASGQITQTMLTNQYAKDYNVDPATAAEQVEAALAYMEKKGEIKRYLPKRKAGASHGAASLRVNDKYITDEEGTQLLNVHVRIDDPELTAVLEISKAIDKYRNRVNPNGPTVDYTAEGNKVLEDETGSHQALKDYDPDEVTPAFQPILNFLNALRHQQLSIHPKMLDQVEAALKGEGRDKKQGVLNDAVNPKNKNGGRDQGIMRAVAQLVYQFGASDNRTDTHFFQEWQAGRNGRAYSKNSSAHTQSSDFMKGSVRLADKAKLGGKEGWDSMLHHFGNILGYSKKSIKVRQQAIYQLGTIEQLIRFANDPFNPYNFKRSSHGKYGLTELGKIAKDSEGFFQLLNVAHEVKDIMAQVSAKFPEKASIKRPMASFLRDPAVQDWIANNYETDMIVQLDASNNAYQLLGLLTGYQKMLEAVGMQPWYDKGADPNEADAPDLYMEPAKKAVMRVPAFAELVRQGIFSDADIRYTFKNAITTLIYEAEFNSRRETIRDFMLERFGDKESGAKDELVGTDPETAIFTVPDSLIEAAISPKGYTMKIGGETITRRIVPDPRGGKFIVENVQKRGKATPLKRQYDSVEDAAIAIYEGELLSSINQALVDEVFQAYPLIKEYLAFSRQITQIIKDRHNKGIGTQDAQGNKLEPHVIVKSPDGIPWKSVFDEEHTYGKQMATLGNGNVVPTGFETEDFKLTGRGVAAFMIHQLDAWVLRETYKRGQEEGLFQLGFNPIHDSYGTHPAEAKRMKEIWAEVMQEVNTLNLFEQVLKDNGLEDMGIKIPTMKTINPVSPDQIPTALS